MSKILKIIFVCFFLGNITTSPAAEIPTQTVRGTVADKVSKNSLPGASVILLNTNPLKGTATDADGRFRLEKVPVGYISLKFSFVGYKDLIISNIILNTGKELVLDIELEESVISQQGIEVKANADKISTNNKMATVSARGFTVEETGRYAGSRSDVARMASNFAGMTGANDARNDIIIRGNSPNGLLWRLEGVDIPNPNHYGSPTSTGGPVCMINNNLLSNSDFLTGAFPAEFGNAISGVFDLRMRNGNNEKPEFLGQIGFNGVEFGAEGPINKEKGSSYLANYRYSTLSVMAAMGADLGTGTAIPYYQDASFKVNLPKNKIGSFAIFGLGGISDIKLWDSKKDTTKTKLDLYSGDGLDLTNGARMFTGGVIHTVQAGKEAFFKTIVAASYHQFKTDVDSLLPGSTSKTRIYSDDLVETSFSLSSSYNRKFSSRDNIKTGFSIRDLGFNLKESVLFRTEGDFRPVSDFNGSAFLVQPYFQFQHKFSDFVVLNTGLHYQFYTLNSTSSLEPRIGLSFSYASNRTLSLAYGLHSQLLPISVYFRQTLMPDGSYRMLNEDIGMLKSHHFVLSHDWNINEFTRLKTEVYYQYIFNAGIDGAEKNYFSVLNEGANFVMWTPDTLSSKGTGQNYGIEMTFERFLNKGLYYLFTVSLYDSKYKGSDGIERNTAFNGNYVVNALVGKEVELTSGKSNGAKTRNTIGFDLKFTLAGGQRYIPFDMVPDPATNNSTYMQFFQYDRAFSEKFIDYIRTDLKIVYKRNGRHITQEWGIDIENLFDDQNIYLEKFNRKTGEKSFAYQMGRLIIPQYRIIF